MPRVTLWVPDELAAMVRSELPDANWSAALQSGLRAALECDHPRFGCSACGDQLERSDVTGPPLSRFFSAVMARLGHHVDQAGYEGAARLVRTVAIDHGVPGVTTTPLPRPTRRQLEARAERVVTDLPLEAGARRRHPTTHQPATEATA